MQHYVTQLQPDFFWRRFLCAVDSVCNLALERVSGCLLQANRSAGGGETNCNCCSVIGKNYDKKKGCNTIFLVSVVLRAGTKKSPVSGRRRVFVRFCIPAGVKSVLSGANPVLTGLISVNAKLSSMFADGSFILAKPSSIFSVWIFFSAESFFILAQATFIFSVSIIIKVAVHSIKTEEGF